jgi:class 3 adenylate cyclase
MAVCAACGRESPDDFGFCPGCGAPLAEAPAAREVRKVVTVLFCDLTGSTAIGERTDPEALRSLMNRYFDTARGVLERHGGTVEKFVGDAVMAVFGIPAASEDDALRATRAAFELRDVVHGLGLDARIGVNTGPVMAGEGGTLVTGDAVNVAARLEQAAGPGEILLGEDTLRLVRNAVAGERVELAVKGKAEPVAAFRPATLETRAEGVARHLESPLVGRARERERLRADFDDVTSTSSCRLFTLIGPAGVGKSRLVADYLQGIDGRATVARGRALSYGEGITYWPLVELLGQLGVEPGDAIASSPGDTQLATRALLERFAEERPLVLVLDDLHWAQPPLLDLVEHVCDWSRGAPIFLLCIARPELLDVRPGWGGGKLNATSVLLEPLDDDVAAELADRLLDGVAVEPGTRARILETAEGNPLFLEEMAALAREARGTVEVPPTIQALLQARLDTLGADERTVIERGAVEGKVFHRGSVTALAPETLRDEVPARLLALVRKELVRPDRASIPGDDAFRFRHLLIRDTAYDSLPKAVRAELHERFADWLEAHAALYEQDEILGYHLEQASRYRAELDPADTRAPELAERAGRRLGAAGRAAFEGGDLHTTRSLLERAVELLPPGSERQRLHPYLLYALLESGAPTFQATLEELERGNDVDRAVVVPFRLLSSPDMSDPAGERARLEEKASVLERAGDPLALVFCEVARGFLEWGVLQAGRTYEHYRLAHDRAVSIGSTALANSLVGWVMTAITRSGRLGESRAVLDEIEAQSARPGPIQAATLRAWRARLDYEAGAVPLAGVRPVIEEQISLLEQTGATLHAYTAASFLDRVVPFLEHDPEALARGSRAAAERSIALWPIFSANDLARWALSLCGLGDPDHALRIVAQARPLSQPGDLADEIVLDSAEAWALALHGDPEPAHALLTRARAVAAGIDFYDALFELEWVDAKVHADLGDRERARTLLSGLVEWNEQRGRRRYADRYRRDLAELG